MSRVGLGASLLVAVGASLAFVHLALAGGGAAVVSGAALALSGFVWARR